MRCVTDIKQNNMKQEEEKSFKVQIPEGYEIDKENSTFECIKFKKLKSEYPKSWNEAFVGNNVFGYWVGSSGEIRVANRIALRGDKNTFKYEEQAESMLAYAQLTQLMALPCYNGDWVPNWDDPKQEKYCIKRMKYDIVKLDYRGYFSFLAFKSEKVRDIFFNNHMDLIRQFYQL